MLRNLEETPLRPFRGSGSGTGSSKASKSKGKHTTSLALKVRHPRNDGHDLTPAKREVRTHALVMLGRKDKTAQVPPPPSRDRINAFYETGKGGPKGEVGKLRLDLEGPIGSLWNKRAARCFRRDFQKSGCYGSWPKADIEEAFLRHTETIRSHYKRQTGGLADDDLLRRSRSARAGRLQKASSVAVSR